MEKKIKVKEINFDDFIKWYCCDEDFNSIFDYFDNEVGIDIRPYIGKQIVVIENDFDHIFSYTTAGDENFDFDAVESYFDYLDNK